MAQHSYPQGLLLSAPAGKRLTQSGFRRDLTIMGSTFSNSSGQMDEGQRSPNQQAGSCQLLYSTLPGFPPIPTLPGCWIPVNHCQRPFCESRAVWSMLGLESSPTKPVTLAWRATSVLSSCERQPGYNPTGLVWDAAVLTCLGQSSTNYDELEIRQIAAN